MDSIMNIRERKERRAALWVELKELIASVAEKESAIRQELSEIQTELYIHEMTPVMYSLIKKESEETITDDEKEKLAMLNGS